MAPEVAQPRTPGLPPGVASADAWPAAESARERRRLAQRMTMLGMILASYWVDAAMLALFWKFGAMALDAAIIAAAGGTAACAVFHQAYRRGWCDGWQDRNLTLPQVLVAAVIQLAIAYRVPEATLLALMILFIVFAIAALRLPPRHILIAWGLGSVAIVLVAGGSPGRLALPGETAAQSLLSGAWVALVLGRCVGVGFYGSAVRRKLAQRSRELTAATGQLELLATRDGLTGALNRAAIVRVLEQSLANGHEAGPAAVLLVDMDHFKSVNDVHGHGVGDEVLRRFVVVAAPMLRSCDRLGRYGGEEFLVVLPSLPGSGSAVSIGERLCGAVAAQDWDSLAQGLRVTVSIGIAVARNGESVDALVARADQALYRTKGEGRNGLRLAP